MFIFEIVYFLSQLSIKVYFIEHSFACFEKVSAGFGQDSANYLGSNWLLLGSWPHSPPPPSTKGLFHLSIYLCIHLAFTYLFIYQSIYLSNHHSFYLSFNPSMNPLLYLSAYPSSIYLYLSITLSVYLPIHHLSIYVYLFET